MCSFTLVFFNFKSLRSVFIFYCVHDLHSLFPVLGFYCTSITSTSKMGTSFSLLTCFFILISKKRQRLRISFIMSTEIRFWKAKMQQPSGSFKQNGDKQNLVGRKLELLFEARNCSIKSNNRKTQGVPLSDGKEIGSW